MKPADLWRLAVEVGSGVYGGTLATFSAVLIYLFLRYRKQGWSAAVAGAALAVEGVRAVTVMSQSMRDMALDARASREAAVRSEAALVRIEAQGALAGLALARVEATLAALVK